MYYQCGFYSFYPITEDMSGNRKRKIQRMIDDSTCRIIASKPH